jgi:prepilin-type N-terminal cleavage/methylation domain-containing protein
MTKNTRGFTLIELLVATAVFAIFMIGILNLLDTSTKLTVTETALADTQENVRFAAYHIMRSARMMGSSLLPFADDSSGTAEWVAGELISNASGTAATPFGNVAVIDGSDVLTIRGFFELPPFFTERSDIKSGPDRVEVRESSGGRVINSSFDLIQVNGLEGRGLFFLGNLFVPVGENNYAVAEIGVGATITGTTPNRLLTIPFIAGAAQWSGLNQSGVSVPPVPFNAYRVGVMESYTYYVDPNRVLQRMRANSAGATSQPVAINIGSLQVALGVDNNNDNQIDAWMTAPTAANVAGNQVIAMRITVLGRTPRIVADWTEPATTFQVEDLNISDVDRSAKWRRIEVAAALRNYLY